MFGRIRPESQCFEGYGQNSNVSKDETKIPKFGRIKSEIQCLDG